MLLFKSAIPDNIPLCFLFLCFRVVDMSHSLIQQIKEKQKQVLCIVKERIVTTQPCSVIEEVQQGGQCGGSLSPKISKVQ